MKIYKKIVRRIALLVGVFLVTAITAFGQKQSTFVIVHGAWGGSWSFKQTDSILTSKGYTVYRPSLTGQGERVHLTSPDIDLNTHILDVVNTILYENLNDIILVGHSYGGMVITGVADSIPERIGRLVYLDAFVPNDGESVISSRTDGKIGPEHESTDGFVVPGWMNENDPLPRDVPQSLKTFTAPVSRRKQQTLSLPATYIFTVEEGKKPEEDHFFFFAERARKRGWKMIVMTADHNPQQSSVNELVKLLIQEVAYTKNEKRPSHFELTPKS
ncbi:alpha/beta hydrolase [uncultured Proteiniphilum sp.]|uniref:alpha/beta hydrolase n=1 Tax=uncultured Proteiniphilum sp. TaxID=497637 RepID=UPI00262059AC|nr:alpha/beta hydrolase [uncultured Proteiniphilum sp.]